MPNTINDFLKTIVFGTDYLQAQQEAKQKQAFFDWLTQQGVPSGTNVGVTPTGEPMVIPSQAQRTPLPQPAPIRPPAFPPTQLGVTGRTISPTGGTITIGQTPESKAQQAIVQQVGAQTGKEAAKLSVTSKQIQAMARQSVAQLKGMYEEQGGSGISKGLWGAFNVALKNPKFSRSAAFEGMRNDFATRLGRIYGGSGRIAARIIEMAKKSLPDRFDSLQMAADKIAQTVWNAENIARAAKGTPLLSQADRQTFATSILAEPAVRPTTVKNVPQNVPYRAPILGNDEILKKLNLDPDKYEIVR